MSPSFWDQLRSQLGFAGNHAPLVTEVAGGCIHRAQHVRWGSQHVFVKTSTADAFDMFDQEASALRLIAATKSVKVPLVVSHGVIEDQAYIALEWLELVPLQAKIAKKLGTLLVEFHQQGPKRFGLETDNYIGATRQLNGQYREKWSEFYVKARLQPQLSWAAQKGYRWSQGEQVLGRVTHLLEQRHIVPGWLHGDLWSGNVAATADGEPVIFDPALYAGDPLADIAMTQLFGGLPREFYEAYANQSSDKSFDDLLMSVYNLYHALNHVNLFGSGYCRLVEGFMDQIMA